MSRMDILNPAEISSINRSSILFQKYSQSVDRESAYEILSKKISDSQNAEAQADAQKEWERTRRGDGEMTQTRTPSRTSSGSIGDSLQKDVVKVLTSATFIRGVFGILKKVM